MLKNPGSKRIADTKLRNKDTLQALVLADDFTTNLSPAHNIYPSILMPIANVRLLDCLIETLIRSQIQEVFLYCSSHVDALKNHVARERYKDILVTLISSDGCRSLGDALRDMDTKGLIRGNFILVRGDAFTNADLNATVALHRIRCEKDKGAAVTLLFRDLGSTTSSSLREQSCALVSNKTNKKVLFYKKLGRYDKKVQLELEWFLNHEQIEIRSGLIDSHVYICSPSVLPLFADNFDFQTMEDFIRGVLMNEEILNARIYWQLLNSEEYALPITSWQAYRTLGTDILQRWGYPLTPDMLPPLRNFSYTSRCVYKHRTATLARGSTLRRDTIIGEESTIGKNTFVTCSVIGDGCKIGDNVRIKNSHIFSNVTIRDNCNIDDCILFDNCTLDEGCALDSCALSVNVNLSPNDKYENSVIAITNERKIVVTKMSEEDSDANDGSFSYKIKSDSYGESNSSDSEESGSVTNSLRGSPIPDDTNMFLSEVIDSLLRGYQDKLNCDNLILEINSSRYAYNVGIREVTYNVVKAILVLPLHDLADKKVTIDHASYQKILKIMINYFNPIITKYVKSDDAQEDCLHAIQDVAATTHEFLPFIKNLLHLFYNRDILTEEKILEWYESAADDEDKINKEIIAKAAEPFVMWLKEAEEDSSDND